MHLSEVEKRKIDYLFSLCNTKVNNLESLLEQAQMTMKEVDQRFLWIDCMMKYLHTGDKMYYDPTETCNYKEVIIKSIKNQESGIVVVDLSGRSITLCILNLFGNFQIYSPMIG